MKSTPLFSLALVMLADRHRMFWRNLEDPENPRDVDQYPIPSTLVSEQFIHDEQASRLRDVLEQLSRPHATVLELHLAGIENHEIAAQLGVNYNTVRSRLVRAIEDVRERLGSAAG